MQVAFLAFILGLIQALTEFLPVSSSAHLILARAWLDFKIADGLTFDVALHLGTLIAIVVYFWRDIVALARGFINSIARRPDPMARMAWYLIAACIPAAIVGYKYEATIETYFRHPLVIVVTLVLGALLFVLVEHKFRHDAPMERLTLGRALAIGVSQTLAFIPGVSRSGITIVSGMMCGLRRDEAARFSFLLATPITFGRVPQKVDGPIRVGCSHSARREDRAGGGHRDFRIGGWLVIRFLLNFLRKHGLEAFAWYRVILAGVVAAFLLF
jgi:undecaprenyl-diphosphatase